MRISLSASESIGLECGLMLPRNSHGFWGLALLLVACNRPDLLSDSPTSTPRPLTLEEIETVVVATLVAEGEMTAAARPSDTPVPAGPSPTPTDPSGVPTELPTELSNCLVVSNFLNLRDGPGVVYEPPLQTLTSGTVLIPFAKNGDGSWLEVQVQGESTTGWVSADGQFISCNFDPSGLPQGQILPTPAPTNTSTQAPTLTPTPTYTPSPTITPCPKLTNATLDASVNIGTNAVTLTWGSQGGCGPIDGTITATYNGEGSPYQTYKVKGQSGKLTDNPPGGRCGSFNVQYSLVLRDNSGQTVNASKTANVYWLC